MLGGGPDLPWLKGEVWAQQGWLLCSRPCWVLGTAHGSSPSPHHSNGMGVLRTPQAGKLRL